MLCRTFIQKWFLTIITYGPLACGGICIYREPSAFCLNFLIFFVFYCVQDMSGWQQFWKETVDCWVSFPDRQIPMPWEWDSDASVCRYGKRSYSLTVPLKRVFANSNRHILHCMPLMYLFQFIHVKWKNTISASISKVSGTCHSWHISYVNCVIMKEKISLKQYNFFLWIYCKCFSKFDFVEFNCTVLQKCKFHRLKYGWNTFLYVWCIILFVFLFVFLLWEKPFNMHWTPVCPYTRLFTPTYIQPNSVCSQETVGWYVLTHSHMTHVTVSLWMGY